MTCIYITYNKCIFSTRSIQGENQNNNHVVPEYLEINDSAYYQSVELRNNSLETSNAPGSTYSRNTSAYYESIDSRNSNSELSNEQYDVCDNSTRNSIEMDINAVAHQYVNTNIGNTFEQLKSRTYDEINSSV